MQKLTVTFIYGKDDSRKLKYRLTGDIPIGVMLEKLIGFQFIVDSADPKTFNVMHKGIQLTDLSKTFEECEIIDGDEIYLIPTVFDPIPELPENDAPVKKVAPKNRDRRENEEHDGQVNHHRQNTNRQGGHGNSSNNHGRRNQNSSHTQRKQGEFSKPEHKAQPAKSQSQPQGAPQGEKKDGPIPFKPHSRNFHRNHGRRPGNNTNKQS